MPWFHNSNCFSNLYVKQKAVDCSSVSSYSTENEFAFTLFPKYEKNVFLPSSSLELK